MNRFEKVIQILDNAVGGPTAPVSFHGAFWRGVTRNDFVAKPIFGLPLITVGDGAGSNLVKALKGETPFGADQGNADCRLQSHALWARSSFGRRHRFHSAMDRRRLFGRSNGDSRPFKVAEDECSSSEFPDRRHLVHRFSYWLGGEQ